MSSDHPALVSSAAARRVRVRTATAVLFLLALVPRFYVAIAWTREPVWDGHYYDIGARSIAAGSGYAGLSGGAWCHYPVGYSALLGLAYKLFGTGQYVAPLLNAVAGALLAVLSYRLARYATTETRALLAGLLVAASPGLIAYSALLMTEPVAALALVGAALLAVRWRGHARACVLAGLAIGLGTLVRPQSILCAPAIALLAMRPPKVAAGAFVRTLAAPYLRAAATTTLVALLVVAPWSLRNCVVMDGCAFVSTNAGWNLAIGASPRATGRFGMLRASDGCRIVTGQVQQDRCWLRLGMSWIATEPERWLALMPKKLGFTFDHESFPVGYLGEADPRAWPEERKVRARGLLSWTHRLVLIAAPLAFVGYPRRERPTSLLGLLAVAVLLWIALLTPSHPYWILVIGAALLAVTRPAAPPKARGVLAYCCWALMTLVLVHAVFFGEDRYHTVVTPLLCLMAACALRKPDEKPAARAPYEQPQQP